jgi:hypothetical protein
MVIIANFEGLKILSGYFFSSIKLIFSGMIPLNIACSGYVTNSPMSTQSFQGIKLGYVSLEYKQ